MKKESGNPKISVIISTYNAEAWLEKVLWGFNWQTYRDFEVVIADDGSGPATRQLIERIEPDVFYPIKHVWQL
ncbi:MAG: glycosyltransferase, partial [Robiginitalea sp.]